MMCLEFDSLRKIPSASKKVKNIFWTKHNWAPYLETWMGLANYLVVALLEYAIDLDLSPHITKRETYSGRKAGYYAAILSDYGLRS